MLMDSRDTGNAIRNEFTCPIYTQRKPPTGPEIVTPIVVNVFTIPLAVDAFFSSTDLMAVKMMK